MTRFRNILSYVSAVYLAQGLAALRSFINARWLGPFDYGYWGWLAFIVSFGYFLHVGAQEMLLKDIPSLRQQGRLNDAHRLLQLNFSFYSVVLIIGAGVMIAIACALPQGTPPLQRWGWAVAGCVMVLEVLLNFEQIAARSLGAFRAIGMTLLITNFVSLVLTCWLVIRHGMVGMYCVALATPALGWLILHSQTKYPLKFVWAARELQKKISSGWPMVAMGLCYLALGWVDRSIIMKHLGVQVHGYYTLGAMVAALALLFPKGVSEFLEPRLHCSNSQDGNEHSVNRFFLAPVKVLSWLMPPILIAGHFILPWVIRTFLPGYVPGLSVIRLLMWSSYLAGLSLMMKSSLVALGRQYQAIPPILLAIPLNVAVSLWMMRRGFGVTGVAAGSVTALGFVSLWFLLIILRELKEPVERTVRHLVEIYAPFLILGIMTCLYPGFC